MELSSSWTMRLQDTGSMLVSTLLPTESEGLIERLRFVSRLLATVLGIRNTAFQVIHSAKGGMNKLSLETNLLGT